MNEDDIKQLVGSIHARYREKIKQQDEYYENVIAIKDEAIARLEQLYKDK